MVGTIPGCEAGDLFHVEHATLRVYWDRHPGRDCVSECHSISTYIPTSPTSTTQKEGTLAGED